MKEAVDLLLDSGKMTYSEYYRMNNFLEIAKRADEEISKNNQPLQLKQQSFDWFLRYYDSCNGISDEDLQIIWAKILAGEIQNPGVHSLRTLECLKNLSPKEARLFKDFCEISFNRLESFFVIADDAFLDYKGISFADILKLKGSALINPHSSNLRISAKEIPL